MDSPAIELDGLTKRFGARTAVDAVSLRVPPGSVYGLVGPNGAGKTTLMRTMLGFTRATGGSSTLLGHAMPRDHAQVYPRLGVIIEEPRFFPFLTGRENLDQIVAARRPRGAITASRIDEVLAKVELTDRADERVKGYSLGMRQRLGIARALLHDPELLVLDEPSNGLDPAGIRDMRTLLRGLAADGRTVLVSSHLLAEMELMCDHVAVLKDGRLIADGPVDQLMSGGGGGRRILYGVTDPARARELLAGSDLVAAVADAPESGCLHVELVADAPVDASATLNELLVGGGVRVGRIERVTNSLEQRFLEIVE